MSFRIDFDEPLGDEVARIASLRLTDAASLLREQPKGLDEAIHDARKHLKQCRALYRLVASGAKEFQKTENQRLGDIARRLSALRDATALIEATDYLKREVASKPESTLLDRLSDSLARRRRLLTEKSAEAARTIALAEEDLRAAAKTAAGISLPRARRKAAKCLARGWSKVTDKARAALDGATQDEEESLHDLRKRTQDRWMHAALMHHLWPTAMNAIQGQAKALSDMLGHQQDLAVLHATVSVSDDLLGGSAENEAMQQIVLGQQGKLQQACRDVALELFRTSKPSDEKMIVQLMMSR